MRQPRGRGRARARSTEAGRGGGRGHGRPIVVPRRQQHPNQQHPISISNPKVVSDTEETLKIGLTLVGFPESRQNVRRDTNIERFRSFFGVDPEDQQREKRGFCCRHGRHRR